MKKSILETILDPQELSVVFQPIFQTEGGAKSIDSVEALIRGPRETNFMRADVLFDYVRRKKAEAAVDQSCFTAICAAAASLPRDLRINVNVHASTLGHNAGYVDFFRRHAQRQSLPFERFTLEIVEHAPTCNIPELTNSIAELRGCGVRIALDDVGLGQSNYRMMLDCNPEYFKLDAYFVRGLSTDSKRRAVVESLVTLAKALESSVVAEGPTADDLIPLMDLGVDLVQANVLCPAMPLDELFKTGHLGKQPAVAEFTELGAATQRAQDFEARRMCMSAAAGQSFYT
jgi:EAL domain-containing protein (putative c-di-GMP-specific phosphodiesterase class I)